METITDSYSTKNRTYLQKSIIFVQQYCLQVTKSHWLADIAFIFLKEIYQ